MEIAKRRYKKGRAMGRMIMVWNDMGIREEKGTRLEVEEERIMVGRVRRRKAKWGGVYVKYRKDFRTMGGE